MSSEPQKITKRVVDGASFDPEGPSFQWIADAELRGFGLRIQKTRRSFAIRYRAKDTGVQRYLNLGTYPNVTVAKARDLAKKELGRVAGGADPVEERRRKKEEVRKAKEAEEKAVTVSEFAKVYLRRMKDRWTERTRGDYAARMDRNVLPTLGKLPLAEVTRAQVSVLLDEIGHRSGPYDSNRTHSLIRAMYNKASVWGFVPEDRPNPARGIERYKETPRDRWLKPAEVGALIQAVQKEGDPYFRAFVPLLLLTGMRKGELLSARWDHVDLERGEILLTETKSRRPQVRRLSPPAVEILRFLPREESNPHVFPGRKKGSHVTDFKKPWDRARETAKLTDITMHDLRRTAGSYMAQAGVPLQVIGEILGHQHPAITKVYARLSQENEQEALEALGEKLGKLFKPKVSV